MIHSLGSVEKFQINKINQHIDNYIDFSNCKSFTIYNKPTRCNSGSIVFVNNYKYALHDSDAKSVRNM